MVEKPTYEELENRVKELERSEWELSQIFSMSLDLVCIADIKTATFIKVNPAFMEVLGYTEKELLEKSFLDFIHPEDIDTTRAVVEKKLQAGDKVINFENRYRCKDGSYRWLSWVSHPRREEGVTYAIARDITERKQMEKDLRQNEKKFRTLVDQAADMLIVHDIEGHIRDVNQAAINGYGYSREELLSMKMVDLDPDYIERENSGRFWDRFGMNEPYRFEARQRRKDGTIFPVEVILTKLFINEELVIMGLCRDISDRKKAEKDRETFQARLQQAQKMEAVGTLAGGIAHDFNNILFSIVGLSELMMYDFPEETTEYQNAKNIFEAGKRGSELVKKILSFSRQSVDKLVPVQFQSVLKEVVTLCRSTIPKEIEIHHEIEDDRGFIMANPAQLHQIAMNLMTNAFHAVEKSGGTISVKLEETVLQKEDMFTLGLEPGHYHRLTVSDTGEGIDPSIINKIFDPYYTTKGREKGTGLGLSVIHGIIKEYKGDITVDSKLGEGTAFNVYLPVMNQEVAPDTHETSAPLPKGTEHILLVDDEKLIVQTEKQMFEKLGYRVTFRSSSTEALEAFRANPDNFDLVFTDMSMPKMTGEELARNVMAIKPDIPVIICTGFSESINPEKAKAIGINAFLMKPLTAEELARTVRNVLDDAQM